MNGKSCCGRSMRTRKGKPNPPPSQLPHHILIITFLIHSLRAAEIEALSVPASTGKGNPQDDLSEFYGRFNRINRVHADRQAGGVATQEPELRGFLRDLEELVASDGLERVTLEDGEEEVVDRAFIPLLEASQSADTLYEQRWIHSSPAKSRSDGTSIFTSRIPSLST